MPILGLPADPPLVTWPKSGMIGILDLEFTAWKGSFQRNWSELWEWREIVQIGFLLVDAGREFSVCDEVEILVRPSRNPILSDYFTSLTGITQDELEEKAVTFEDAIGRLCEFFASGEFIIFNGNDGEILRENCAIHDMALPYQEIRMYDFSPLLSQTLGRPLKELISSELPTLAGIKVAGRAHTALHDCRAISASLAKWRESELL